MQISTSCIPYLMSFHGTAVLLSEMYDHILREKTYCQSLLILWNYIEILEITLALMTGLFVCLFVFLLLAGERVKGTHYFLLPLFGIVTDLSLEWEI